MASPTVRHATCDGGALGVLPSGVLVCSRCDNTPLSEIPNATKIRDARRDDPLPPTAVIRNG
jgi:hypothetical protein